jgi:hypothetical protein
MLKQSMWSVLVFLIPLKGKPISKNWSLAIRSGASNCSVRAEGEGSQLSLVLV